MKTLVISPTYNERKNITALVEAVFKVKPDYHLLIIDDNSPDGTADLVKELQLRYDNLFLEERPGKAGLGTAYIFGFKWALERNYDVIVQMDADMSHDPNEIKVMVNLLGDYDVVIGSRYIDGVSVIHWPIRRLLLSYGANMYSRIVTGLPVKDSTGGFKAWQKGFSLHEHPIIFTDRTIGESKMSRGIMFEAMIVIWRMRIWKIFGWHK